MFTSFMTNPRTMNNPLREWWLKSITETIRNMSDKQEAERKRQTTTTSKNKHVIICIILF